MKLGKTYMIDGVKYKVVCKTKVPIADLPVGLTPATSFGMTNWGHVTETYTIHDGWKLMDVTGLKSVLYKTEEELQEIDKLSTKLAELL